MLVREREFNGVAGLPVLLGGLVAVGGLVWGIVMGARGEQPALIIGSAVGLAVVGLLMAGLFMVNPNDLRHTFATRLIDRDVPTHSVQVLLGHVRLASTEVYLHSSQARLAEAVGRISR